MTIRGERAIARCIRVPPAAQRFTAGSALDSSRVMTELASNTAHLCEESVRHLVSDPGFSVTVLSAVGLVLTPDTSEDGGRANPLAARTWDRIRFTEGTGRRYGPFSLVADEGAPTSPRARAVTVRCDVLVPPQAIPSPWLPAWPAPMACALLTAGPSIADVVDGRRLAWHEWSLVAGRNELEATLSSSVVISPLYPEQHRMPSSGTQFSAVRCFYLWIGFSLFAPLGELGGDPHEVLSVDAWETRVDP